MRIGIGIDLRELSAFPAKYGDTAPMIGHIQIFGAHETDLKPKEIKSKLTEFIAAYPGVSLSFHAYSGMNLVEEVQRVRNVWIQLAKQLLDLAADVGAIFVNFHAGYGIDANSWIRRQKYREALIPVLQQLLDDTPRTVEIHLENLYPLPRHSDFCYVGDRLSDFNYFFGQITDTRLKLCYDYGHGNLDEYGIETLRQLADRLGSVHAHDNDQVIDVHASMGRLNVGTIPWSEEIRFLKEMRFAGPFILEGKIEEQLGSLEYLRGMGLE
jgi:sugar phosphate isomerase/epimerase